MDNYLLPWAFGKGYPLKIAGSRPSLLNLVAAGSFGGVFSVAYRAGSILSGVPPPMATRANDVHACVLKSVFRALVCVWVCSEAASGAGTEDGIELTLPRLG